MKERLVICNEEDTGGRARVTRDEKRVIGLDFVGCFVHFVLKHGFIVPLFNTLAVNRNRLFYSTL